MIHEHCGQFLRQRNYEHLSVGCCGEKINQIKTKAFGNYAFFVFQGQKELLYIIMFLLFINVTLP